MNEKLSIIILTYNEDKTILLVLDKIKDMKLYNDIEKGIIMVNDCFTDNTEEIINIYRSAHPNLTILYFKHETNKGKAANLHTSMKYNLISK